MLPREPNKSSAGNLRKFSPHNKMPTANVQRLLTPEQVKALKLLLDEHVEYVANEMLDQSHAEQLLRRPLTENPDREPNDDSSVHGLTDQEKAVWALDREIFFFLRFNYCRRHLCDIMNANAGRRLNEEATRDVLKWHQRVRETREEIIRQNVPLVLAMAKRTRIVGVDISDLISEGNLALMRAVNKFDCAKGYKFSTYACRAILKSFSRVAARASRHRNHFPTEFDPSLEKSDFVERRRAEQEDNVVHDLKTILGDNLANLSDVERKVIEARFALDADKENAESKAHTLEQVGQMIGVTKERVRQIQNKALGKLRDTLDQVALAQ